MKFVVGKGQEKRCPSSLAPPSLVLWWPEGPQAAGFKTNSHICVEALQEPESSLVSLANIYIYIFKEWFWVGEQEPSLV